MESMHKICHNILFTFLMGCGRAPNGIGHLMIVYDVESMLITVCYLKKTKKLWNWLVTRPKIHVTWSPPAHKHACKFPWMIGCFHVVPNAWPVLKSQPAPKFILVLDLVIGGLPMCVLSYIFAWHRGSSGQRPWVRLLHNLVHCHLARLCEDLFSAAIRDRERASRG